MATDGSLGLPTLPTQPPMGPDGRPASDRDRPYVEFTLPTKVLGLEWAGSGFTQADLVFRVIELTPAAQQQAMKLAGQKDQARMGYELVLASIWQVGDWRARTSRAQLERWYAAIGGKARKLVDAAFMSLNHVEDDEIERFLASGKSGS